MELEHSFTIPVPPEQAWGVLLDVEKVAPCMPGATIDSVDGDAIKGRIKVKVGPVALTYAGTARFTEKDEQARKVVLEASGKETRGSGTAAATITSTLSDEAGQTRVVVHTTMTVTGRPAQFGRGVMAEVSGRVIEKFATNLAAQLSGGAAAPAASAPAAAAATSTDTERQSATAVVSGPGGNQAPADQAPEDQAKVPIEDLNLPVRSYNSLRREGVHTVGSLTALSEQDLLAIDGLGPASVKEIRSAAGRSGPQPGHGGRGQRWHQRRPGCQRRRSGRAGAARPAWPARPPRPPGPARWPAGWPTRIWLRPTACCRRRAPGRRTRTRSTC